MSLLSHSAILSASLTQSNICAGENSEHDENPANSGSLYAQSD